MSIDELNGIIEYLKEFGSKNWLYAIIAVLAFWFIVTTIKDIRNRQKSTGNYRNDFIKAHKGKRRAGKKGYWYRCANCHKWCGRPGPEKATIPDDCKMEVDHIRPWSMGGSDAVWNLQAMCKPCNRSKSNSHSVKDSIKMRINTVLHPVDSIIGTWARKGVRQNKLLKKLGIGKRK